MTTTLRALFVAASIVWGIVTTAIAQDARAAARALESQLVAPCCWVESLDRHDSPLAIELRAEIAARIEAGEPIASIEADLVARHGERIRAIPSGIDHIALAVIAGLTVAALALVAARRRPKPAQPIGVVASRTPTDASLDARLDRELRELDGELS